MNTVVLRRRFPHPVERVFRAVEDPEELAAWCPGPPGEVVEHDPPRLIAWANAGHTVRFELAADGDGTLLTFTHLLPEGEPDQFAEGWETYFTRLDALLAGSPIGEQEAHEQRRLVLGDGPELRLERRFSVASDRLWRALTETDELADWFPEAMEVMEADPPRLLIARWHGTTLRFVLEPDGAATRLTFIHAFADRDQAALTAAGWDRAFVRLEARLNGGDLDERTALQLWPWVHERYAERFGVDPEIGRRAYAAHPAT